MTALYVVAALLLVFIAWSIYMRVSASSGAVAKDDLKEAEEGHEQQDKFREALKARRDNIRDWYLRHRL